MTNKEIVGTDGHNLRFLHRRLPFSSPTRHIHRPGSLEMGMRGATWPTGRLRTAWRSPRRAASLKGISRLATASRTPLPRTGACGCSRGLSRCCRHAHTRTRQMHARTGRHKDGQTAMRHLLEGGTSVEHLRPALSRAHHSHLLQRPSSARAHRQATRWQAGRQARTCICIIWFSSKSPWPPSNRRYTPFSPKVTKKYQDSDDT